MITYILESLAFQLVFLLAYDLFLKKETFFQWNRTYLLGTFALSIILPWVKVEALTTPMPDGLQTTTVFLTQLNGVVLGPGAEETSILQQISWPYLVLGLGSLFATIWFAYKLVQIKRLRHKGAVEHYREFTKVTVPQSTSAFSFFRNIFMGEEIQKDKEDNILAHELVHVKQWHSLDLLFFELARIVFWFNPLVYIYQNRVAELHEFIADERAVKHNKADHFEMLLSQAFHTQNISFVNQFFNRSLIKKRIVMLQKKKSKAVWQLKYVLLLPLVLGMLVYTSCESEKSNTVSDSERQLSLEERLQMLNNEIEGKDSLTESERNQIAKMAQTMIDQTNKSASEVNGWTVKAGINPPASVERDSTDAVAFAVIDEVPIFPGCENAVDKKQCFNEKIVEHIKKHFRYPEAAEKQGIQGRVSILFTIDTNGEISSIKKRGPSEILENEAVRIIERLPKMQPGKHKGETVNVPFAIPITFKLKDQAKDENEQTNSNKGEMKVGGILANKDNASLFIGKVTDEESMGIPGVTISVVGKNEDVISGFDGHFKIVVNEGETLKFQYIGLPNKLVRVDKKEFLIGLLEKANAENKS
ncbi:M56 family metallopeptidase [Allomuricauda sp. ARW1Y1]|jgi:TonB family protein|uniref:M56 family metallopeptidase n=1 Tax=Allomuricauda sp. ARW1Y1 TaxID=2663843 RepID=UPI0017D46705|nr:M56 family metallopeptidase [Muricauda sp. ARW1Y1]NYJ26772.1 TonB family protein [Muricauda sp. ARW1Y1]